MREIEANHARQEGGKMGINGADGEKIGHFARDLCEKNLNNRLPSAQYLVIMYVSRKGNVVKWHHPGCGT